MTPPRLVLASASPARLRLLRTAGFEPEVVVSGVAEEGLTHLPPGEQALTLARRKAAAVARRVEGDAVVVGCDSVLDVDGEAAGKPGTAAAATERWRQLRGRVAVLCTGHCAVRTSTGEEAAATASTVVRFGEPTDAEVAAYIATGEPLGVAGAFTIDGRGAPFVDGIDGDPSNVIGLSLPLLRSLLRELRLDITELWA